MDTQTLTMRVWSEEDLDQHLLGLLGVGAATPRTLAKHGGDLDLADVLRRVEAMVQAGVLRRQWGPLGFTPDTFFERADNA